ncbi:MAG: GtrA family protein [Clostridia bacterium]|nr:GtrA family protein [Clostridia bacterium]
MSNRLKEIIKFAFTGGVCFLIEYAALIVLKEWLHLSAVAATPIAFLVSVVFNYLLCVKWVFSGAKEGSKKAQLGFAITSVMGLFLNWAIMWALTALFGEDAVLLALFGLELKVYMLNKIIATGLVMVWNYFTKRWLLKG